MEYELYHDESLEGGYWHGMLLVPVEKKITFLNLLDDARRNAQYFAKLGIKNVKEKGHIYNCAFAWAQIAVCCLRSNTKCQSQYAFTGRREKGNFLYKNIDCFGMKFVLFRVRDNHDQLTGFHDPTSKIETTFRFGMKGGLHFLGSHENPIEITKIHFDGHEHYGRHIDKHRIVDRIYGLREYCSILNKDNLIDDRHSNHKKTGCQDYADCQFLQLTDILIGCFRTSFGYKTKDIHCELARPIMGLVKKSSKGYARMRNSRWFNSYVTSQCYLENGQWIFEGIDRCQPEATQPRML